MKLFKKISLAIVAMAAVTTSAAARDSFSRDASVLPKAAQTVLSNNMKTKVNLVKIEKDFGRVSEYEVIMTDGTEVNFDRDGNWKSVEVGAGKSVPSGFVPDAIAKYVKSNHSGQKIVGIEKEKKGYEVELSNGIDMKFDTQGNFLRYD